jgi:hypothetical protein
MLEHADAHPDVDLEHHAEVLADIVLGGIAVPDSPAPGDRTKEP